MKLLVFEYATASGVDDPFITVEGLAMLEGVLDDLKEFKPHYLVPKESSELISDTVPIVVNGDVGHWLNMHIKEYDACLPIVPEEDGLLHDLTQIIERNGVKVFGSNSNAIQLTTDKFEMYKVLAGKVPVIKTEKIYFKQELEELGRAVFQGSGLKVIKPADGVSSSGVMVVASLEEFLDGVNNIQKFTKLPYFVMQDYKPGHSVSVSLLSNGKTAVPISLNLQDVEIESCKVSYHGGKVPYDHDLSVLAKDIAKQAVELFEGIMGFVGVDLILGEDEVHLVEINSRLTTPYVALRRITNINLGRALMNSVDGELPADIQLDGQVGFYKEGKSLRVSVLK
ncbi:MAG: ATP-grasp domain-containing protein [Methanobacterium sp. ERen5]|nr:MAG: ATP-grasp domain-containing protein [Methanobacterium sp. ERen5]